MSICTLRGRTCSPAPAEAGDSGHEQEARTPRAAIPQPLGGEGGATTRRPSVTTGVRHAPVSRPQASRSEVPRVGGRRRCGNPGPARGAAHPRRSAQETRATRLRLVRAAQRTRPMLKAVTFSRSAVDSTPGRGRRPFSVTVDKASPWRTIRHERGWADCAGAAGDAPERRGSRGLFPEGRRSRSVIMAFSVTGVPTAPRTLRDGAGELCAERASGQGHVQQPVGPEMVLSALREAPTAS